MRLLIFIACLMILSSCAYTPPPPPSYVGEFSAINKEYHYTPPKKKYVFTPTIGDR